jgi:c-di-GMP-binding flagellar brake protein YcgR
MNKQVWEKGWGNDHSGVKKNERIFIVERRSVDRLKEDNEITITVVSGKKNLSKEKIIYALSTDISESGARIQVNSFLPVDTILKIKVAVKDPPQMITAFGKVKWIKLLFASDFYEAGLEFVNTSNEMIQQLADYISSKQ